PIPALCRLPVLRRCRAGAGAGHARVLRCEAVPPHAGRTRCLELRLVRFDPRRWSGSRSRCWPWPSSRRAMAGGWDGAVQAGAGGAAVAVVPAPAAPPLADSTFARLIAELSEPGGYFDTDNLISNEASYLHV